MNTLLRWTPAVLAVLVCGCRSNVSHELLERELLAQENQIFQLQDLVDEYETKLDSCRRENESLLAELGRSRTGKSNTPRRSTGAEELAPPVVEPGAEGPALPFNGPPVIAPPDAQVPEGEHMAKGGAAGRKSRLTGRNKARSVSNSSGPIDLVVTQITLNRKLTGGHNVDGRPGDEGVMVVVEPLNAAGDLIEVPGEVSIVVLDPTLEGDAARVARWDFNSLEAADHIKRTPMGDGLHFDLRWPHSPPTHRVLNLYVRYTTSDGRRLQVEKQIEIDPLGGEEPADRVTENHDAKSDHVGTDDKKDSESPGNTARRADQQNSAQKRGTQWEPYR
ncbi:MAG TPA: hypothetical protein VHC22_11010 [Pirellulales bacterium]|nr:hypothetical protein [Pirellulales bacterium]